MTEETQYNFPASQAPEMPDFDEMGLATQMLEGMVGQVEEEAANEQMESEDRENRSKLLDWAYRFFISSRDWRAASFEDKWRLYQRNSDAIYSPEKSAQKESWQSKAFIALTPSHRETIQAQLFRTLVGPRPMLEVKARVDSDNDQSDNIRDLILREMEKSDFEIQVNRVLEDCTTFGSGFARIRYERKTEDRRIRTPQYAPVEPTDPAMMGQLPPVPQVIGYQDTVEEVEVFNGVKFEALSIWDIFPDPKALEVGQGPIVYRYRLTYDEIVKGVEAGYYDPEAIDRLRNEETSEKAPDDVAQVLADRGVQDTAPKRPDYGRVLECYELWAKLPQKWVVSADQIQGDPEKLVPARVNFTKDVLLSREISEEHAGVAPIYKMDYWPVNGQFYARGIPEMLKDYQELLNETINQRIDNVSLVLNKMYAVIERAVIDPKDFTSKPGGVIRLDGKHVQDIRQAFQEVPSSDVTASAYREAIEYERYSQERSSANRVTIGTAGQVKDANQTLGGMELLRQSAGEKFAYIGMLQEFGFMRQVAKAYYRLVYANIQPQEVVDALGQQRAMTFELLSPEYVEKSYFYIPQGVFTMENRAMRHARLDAVYRTFALEPFVDKVAFFDRELKSQGEDPQAYRLSPEEMQQQIMAQMQMQQAQAPLGDAISNDPGLQKQAKDQEDLKRGLK